MNACSIQPGIQIRNMYLRRGNHQIFTNFSLELEVGRVTALLAPSGAGKTSLLDCLAGLLEIDQGTITGVGPVSYLFQEPRLLPWYSLERNVMLPLENLFGNEAALERSRHFLGLVELGDKAATMPSQCSGGQRQRCALARAFAYPSSTLLMDEAFQSQDIKLKLRLMELTEELLGQCKDPNQPDKTTLLVTHDVSEALALAHRVLVLSGSPLQVVGEFEGASKSLPMSHRYIKPDDNSVRSREEILKLLWET